METRSSHLPEHKTIVLRLGLLCLFFLAQFEIVEIALRRYYDATNIGQSIWAPIPGRRFIFSFGFVFLAAFLAASFPRLKKLWADLQSYGATHAWRPMVAVQAVVYAVFAAATYLLSAGNPQFGVMAPLVLFAWLLLLLATGCLALLTLAPAGFWRGVLVSERDSLLAACLAGFGGIGVTWLLSSSWPSMVNLTLQYAETLLALFYDDVFTVPATDSLGTTRFEVRVTPACAGYEGMSLIIVFLSLYMWLFRSSLRFPAVLLMFPLGIAAMWLFNGLRIATLVAIGDSLSPEIAITGFHSNAGWIAFILVSMGMIALMHKVPLFCTAPAPLADTEAGGADAELATALLVPFIMLMAATLLISAATSGFAWLYPVKVVAAGAALLFFRKAYAFARPWLAWEPLLIGLVVFALWMLLVPASVEKTTLIAGHLDGMGWVAAGLWLAFRVLGSVIVVPLAEELAFRGYLLSRMSGAGLNTDSRIRFAWLPFLATSLLFGAVHGAWVAGTLAGMAYALARYRRGRVSDAVLAHITTNGLLSLYVLATQEWSYW